MQEKVGATADEQVEHHLKKFVAAVDAHWHAPDSEGKRNTRNAKAECEVALVRAFKNRPKKSKPER